MTIKNNAAASAAICVCLAAIALGFVVLPQQLLSAARDACTVAFTTLLPSIFPFMVIIDMLQHSCFSLVENSRLRYAFSVLFSFLGGFACGARMVCNMTREGIISKQSAAYVLCGTINSGPAFVVCAVGAGMLGSTYAGFCIYLSLVCASALNLIVFSRKIKLSSVSAPAKSSVCFGASLTYGIKGIASVCGVSVFFACVLAVLRAAIGFGKSADYALFALFDVTSACVSAAALPHAVFLCCAAVSVVSLTVLIQISVQTSALGISLKPFLLSRLLHMPLSLGILYLLLRASTALELTGIVYGAPSSAAFAAPPLVALLLFFALAGTSAALNP